MNGSTTLRQMTLTPEIPLSVKPIIDITDSLPRTKGRAWPKRETTRRIIVHHSAVEGSIKGYANHHVYTKKRVAICYHTVVQGGQAYQVNDWADRTDHAAYNNDDTISVCVSGDFTKREMTQAERDALYAVILTYMDVFQVPVELVLGHGEVRPTACPGFDMRRVREDVHALHEQMDFNRNGANIALVVALASRVENLRTKAEGGRFAEEAKRKLDTLSWVLKSAGVKSTMPAADHIMAQYQTYMNGGEGAKTSFAELVAVANEAKKLKLIA